MTDVAGRKVWILDLSWSPLHWLNFSCPHTGHFFLLLPVCVCVCGNLSFQKKRKPEKYFSWCRGLGRTATVADGRWETAGKHSMWVLFFLSAEPPLLVCLLIH